MARFVINNIDQLNLLLDKVQAGSPGSYDFINRYFQALLENDNFLLNQIKKEVQGVIDKIEAGEIFIPKQEGDFGPGALGIPTFLCDTEPEVEDGIDYIWFKPIRKSQQPEEEPEEGVILFVLDAEESDDGWHLNVNDLLYTILNTAEFIEGADDGDVIITPADELE